MSGAVMPAELRAKPKLNAARAAPQRAQHGLHLCCGAARLDSAMPALGDASRHGTVQLVSLHRDSDSLSLMVRARATPARPEALEGRTMAAGTARWGLRPSRRPARAGLLRTGAQCSASQNLCDEVLGGRISVGGRRRNPGPLR
jgi:hypothetical protein